MAQKKNSVVTGFLYDHGFGPERLRLALTRVHWTRADGFARGRAVLDRFLRTALELLIAAARRKRVSPAVFIGSLVAGGDPQERPLLWLVVRYAEEFTDVRLKVAPARLVALERSAAPMRAHWALLTRGDVPAVQLALIAPGKPKSILVWQWRQLQDRNGDTSSRATLQLLRLAGRLGGNDTDDLVRSVRQLLADGPRAPLSHASFRRLPTPLRRTILFTPGHAEFFLDAQAQAAVRPPSPDFDPLYLDHALTNLAAGTIDHTDLDALVIGAAHSAVNRTRIVSTLANGSGALNCSNEIRERLILGADQPEICLLACAAANRPDDVHRALARLQALPTARVLGEALRRFAIISCTDWLPAEVPRVLQDNPAFAAGMLDGAARRLAAHLAGDDLHLAPTLLFRHFVAWLELVTPPVSKRVVNSLADAFAQYGHRLAGELDGAELHALANTGADGERLAMALLGACRTHEPTLWANRLFGELVDADPQRALACAWGDFRAHEIEQLLHSSAADAVLRHFARPANRGIRAWREFLGRVGSYAALPGVLATAATSDAQLLRELLVAVPPAFDLALAHLPIEDIVDIAMRDRELARRLEQRLGRAHLAGIGHRYAQRSTKRPAYTAAQELALAIGLPHGPYLAFLARRLRPPFDETTRGRRFDDLYHSWTIPKRNGGERTITAPDRRLKAVQRAILDQLLARLPLHHAARGFVKGLSIVDNAKPHVQQTLVANMDVQDFFPTTRFSLIRRACLELRQVGLSERACMLIAEICSYQGALPIGAPTSPALANIILRPLDRALTAAAQRRDVQYTRYADDLSFSGERAASLLPFARRLLSGYGYAVDERKTNLFRSGRRQVVTGLVVNERPNVARPLRRRLRAAVHQRADGKSPRWDGRNISDNQLLGLLAFLAQTQPDEARALRNAVLAAPPLTEA